MSTKVNSRERITCKDIENITGYKRAKAFSLLRAIKVAKMVASKRAGIESPVEPIVSVDDFARYTGLSREVVKAGLVD
ncbi:hypothetical protein GO755_22635 [Spirosoma sp. HMF4905]|uniref:Uncharacterized protein n=1 Tax=Spirosoma arboris TaxID=2682092 RepID=A0A7K1SGL9_9BACT|nr:hypothetical protein [Spirosoma arboris]MVM32854.1 hypothetical protein [Spirosoma arboris]